MRSSDPVSHLRHSDMEQLKHQSVSEPENLSQLSEIFNKIVSECKVNSHAGNNKHCGKKAKTIVTRTQLSLFRPLSRYLTTCCPWVSSLSQIWSLSVLSLHHSWSVFRRSGTVRSILSQMVSKVYLSLVLVFICSSYFVTRESNEICCKSQLSVLVCREVV